MEKEYIVTLYKTEDLEGFYEDMEEAGIKLKLKRPMSRNTHYLMTPEQATEVEQDPRVKYVELYIETSFKVDGFTNNEGYTESGNFRRFIISGNPWPTNDLSWGFSHTLGNSTQRAFSTSYPYPLGEGRLLPADQYISASFNVFDNGKNVDMIIADDEMAVDMPEWNDSQGNTRFVQYQWFTELNQDVLNLGDLDNQNQPSGNITYRGRTQVTKHHATHVAGIACGKKYGFAKEANIYNLVVVGSWGESGQSVNNYLLVDYIRAFHRKKIKNNNYNPTIVNASIGDGYIFQRRYTADDIDKVYYRGVLYNQSDSVATRGFEWTDNELKTRFGLISIDNQNYLPSANLSLSEDFAMAKEEGIVFVTSAGNDGLFVAEESSNPSDDWNNYVVLKHVVKDGFTSAGQPINSAALYSDPNAPQYGYNIYYNRGANPGTPTDRVISVGALDIGYRETFQDSGVYKYTKSDFSRYGNISIFAPGVNIISSVPDTYTGTKYGNSTIGYSAALPGTSQASPHVAGVAACLASGNIRFTHEDFERYMSIYSIYGEIGFDMKGGTFSDYTVGGGISPNKVIHLQNPRSETGFIDSVKGSRQLSGQAFPRRNKLNKA